MSFDTWFYRYCQLASQEKDWPQYRERFLCPCCTMPTLSERARYEICPICFWEDDGQDSDDADEVRGGPNHDYSLSEARTNFARHHTMYRPGDGHHFEREQKAMPMKKALFNAFAQAMERGDDAHWRAALAQERAYYDAQRWE
ncbi:CPCC family cysteine-rich protein [Ferrimonas balearica]|uniref:CPCC family cysteine-rich protein n=1 Tax=Ferrimonas balearica TaxID=44012 RepID=UPI001C9A005A|nr:CPCC family cysteine-rich protein [Ferrimonas balearica]MBY5991324.1 hypothetical protein [Ferrimonas balearica]